MPTNSTIVQTPSASGKRLKYRCLVAMQLIEAVGREFCFLNFLSPNSPISKFNQGNSCLIFAITVCMFHSTPSFGISLVPSLSMPSAVQLARSDCLESEPTWVGNLVNQSHSKIASQNSSVLVAMLRPSPSMAHVLTPRTRPRLSSKGPPEFPGLIAASVW